MRCVPTGEVGKASLSQLYHLGNTELPADLILLLIFKVELFF